VPTATATKKVAAMGSKATKPGPAPQPGALDAFKYKHTPEDAEALAAELIPTTVAADFVDANWKTRLAALDEMNTWLEGVVSGVDSEVMVRFLAKKGWNEKNFQVYLQCFEYPDDKLFALMQVSSKIYGILSMLAERCPSFSRSSAALSIPHLSEKLGDLKLRKPAGDTLLLFAEKTSLSFVLSQGECPLCC